MPQQVRGVVATGKGKPVTVETITIPDPGPGEAVVAVQACGVCHTDLHYREGGINDDFPFLLGHEAAGVVESVGEGVTDVAPGDFVILNWRAVDGTCRACRRGEPWYCFSTHNAAQKMTLESGQELSPALGIGAFAEKTLVHAGQCTKVNPAAKPEVAGLLGCGVMAGIGAAMNTGGEADDESAEKRQGSFGILLPAYVPEGAVRLEISEVELGDEKGVLLRYGGSYTFTLLESRPTDRSVTALTGTIVDLGHSVGVLLGGRNRTLTWMLDGVEFRLTSADLPSEEMIKIAQSLDGQIGK